MVWGYTPRQLQGWLFFADRRKRHERADALSDGYMAARGDYKDVKKLLKELRK